ncbi:hypothetical protein CPBF426_10670 [Xanthomonas arboricola pv. juglandis]|uniref:hypothetical protein n=1 Tax=Xanthomonas TaxID=338 RepID=UPI000E5C2D11|nr:MULTISPECIES: hypothetical protein [Xanthomonas]CAD1796063.1 hypothetical protein XSP_003521 [Xanthomonas sp. CPBF 426]CAG2095636.1 hypothetical protein XCY_003479 [Xanthomonas euroxanthea]SYZ51453.1 hypothetical protein CPBF426_10670 [Xanthomonas arboricola pv. juglandis]
MQLPAFQQELEARFGQISEECTENRHIFALEHGLTIDMAALSDVLSKQLVYGRLNQAFWLAWVVFATEIGYDYAGAEYWQTFNDRLPAWRAVDTNKGRHRIRMWFRRFASTYNGAHPSGTWADQFRIIAWPVTHAILPKDLQYQFARSIHQNRYQIAADSSPLAIGRLIRHRTAHPSSRFREFCEQEDMVGRIALALLGAETENLPLSPEATRRIVADLETTQEAREWMQEARADIRRIRGVKHQRSSTHIPQDRPKTVAQPRFNLRPTLLLSPKNDAWHLVIQISSFAPLVAGSPEIARHLQKTRVRIEGGSGQWHPAQILKIPSKLHGLQYWPADGVVLRFKDPLPVFDQLMRLEATLSEGPLWVCRIGNDGLAREVRGCHVRPGQTYIVMARTGHAFRPHPALRPVNLRCEGLTGIQLSLPTHVPEDLRQTLKTLGLPLTSTVRIWPAGLPAVSWDGEGRSEWLTTDTPCFGIDVDHDVAALEVALDGLSSLRISRTGVQSPSWVQLPPLPPGEHRMVVEVKDGAGQAGSPGASRGEVILEVRDPLSLDETVQQRGGLMVVATPIDASLESLERNELQLEVYGPAGREAQLFLEVEGCAPYRRPFDRTVVPAKLTHLWRRLPTEIQENLGDSNACRLVIRAEEIGTFALSLERESRPIRWALRRSRQATTIRLVDEAALGAHALCHMAPLDQPCTAQALDYDDCVNGIEVLAPGALFVVAGRDRLDTVVVSQPSQGTMNDFAQLAVAPRLNGFASSAERLRDDVALLGLWSRARVVGPLGAARKGKVVHTMRDALVRFVCGPAWMDVERWIGDPPWNDDAIAALGDAITNRGEWMNFPAQLRMSHREALDMVPAQVVPWLLEITTRYRLCTDPHLVERMLRYLTDPDGFIASSRDIAMDIQSLVAHGELARSVRYLQKLLEGKSWDWN